jgi:hypothetical protein
VPSILALVAQGARRILCIPPDAALPGRIRVHSGGEVPRSELLALVSSVMRHLPVEAGFVSLQRPAATRSEVVESHRALLDARAELRGGHGLDLRTDSHVGDLRSWVQKWRPARADAAGARPAELAGGADRPSQRRAGLAVQLRRAVAAAAGGRRWRRAQQRRRGARREQAAQRERRAAGCGRDAAPAAP